MGSMKFAAAKQQAVTVFVTFLCIHVLCCYSTALLNYFGDT
jgi:hypothetical protein